MQRDDLVLALAEKNYYKKEANLVINDLFGIIARALVNGERVSIRGFGSFEVKKKKGHLFSDPQTKELRTSDDYLSVVFKPGDNLKAAVKQQNPDKLSFLNNS